MPEVPKENFVGLWPAENKPMAHVFYLFYLLGVSGFDCEVKQSEQGHTF